MVLSAPGDCVVASRMETFEVVQQETPAV